jgi:ABC-type xylose transport system permease subunit
MTAGADLVVGQLVFTYLVGLPLAYLAEVLLGLPAWKIFQRYRIQSGIAFALCGGLIGLLPAMLLRFGREGAFLCAMAGLASALLFRGIIFWRVPDSAGD